MRSPQTLSEADRRYMAELGQRTALSGYLDCSRRKLQTTAARVLQLPGHAPLPVASLTSQGVRRRFVGEAAAHEVIAPQAVAAARAAGQAAAVSHMGAHALGAAAYAAKAAGLAAPDQPEAVRSEIRWQVDRMSAAVRSALRQLPPVGENRSGPLGPGLLASGLLGTAVRELQARLAVDASEGA